ncbi:MULTISPECIES: AraC family transcriptional regulator [unclassified Arcicella]|uniref:helix-turn-helix domain-containing protein n=1 Tax=unclassified Arcicella TaxID=2644986 RepID=UPI002858A946|nr:MULTISPECIES: AraC family transcriptional regulator [unclassified Arcicella]MDR6561784.1 AraC-like DNA-binding protein [Arcicella sp. BE51]MDR6812564.1 AraC-like DNA-binding protein [Arcicella sp. BE140]MDR6823664.1 AraC-like DNA-binding protein [Arcicella sp. BE139]
MDSGKTFRIKTISEFHQIRNLSKPLHPLVSVVDLENAQKFPESISSVVLDFYSISLKTNFSGIFRYGQREYDFNEGAMFFMAPNQSFSIEHNPNETAKQSGWKWVLLFHQDLLWNTQLAKSIKQYEFFDYSVNEALFLSEKEEQTINGIIAHIEQECQNNIDKFSKHIIISHIEALLNYAERFYNRQFITREKANHQILERLDTLLNDYFANDNLMSKGLPSVQYIAQNLNISQNYLGGLLKVLTGLSTQQHIHEKLIEKAKEKLSTTNLSISEIAYELGFEHLPSFTKLFRNKTNQTPSAFRQSIS